MWGGASSLPSSSGVIVRCSWLLVRSSSRHVLLALVSLVRAFLWCLCRVCLLSVPCPIVVSFGSPFVRHAGRGECWLRLGLGSPRSLLPVACCGGAEMRRGGSSRGLLVAVVSMVSAGCVISVASVACRGSFYRAGVSRSCRPVACFVLVVVVGRHGLIVIGRRRGSWLVIGRRGSSSSRLACHRGVVVRVSPVGRRRSSRRLSRCSFSRPVLLVGWRGGLRIVSCRLVPSSLLASLPRYRAGSLRLSRRGRLVSGRDACLSRFCLCVSRSCVSLSLDTNIAPSLVLRGGAIFLSLLAFPLFC